MHHLVKKNMTMNKDKGYSLEVVGRILSTFT